MLTLAARPKRKLWLKALKGWKGMGKPTLSQCPRCGGARKMEIYSNGGALICRACGSKEYLDSHEMIEEIAAAGRRIATSPPSRKWWQFWKS
jgi:transcription elongation factor Elf1